MNSGNSLFYSISSLNSMFTNLLFQFVFYLLLCDSQETDANYASRKPLMKSSMLENKLQDHEHYSEDSDTLNSYVLESMPLEIILLMEKTMALLEFDSSGKLLEKCQLFDLEKESDKADSTASTSGLPVVKCDFKTMQEAINKCRELTEKVVPISNQEQTSPNITSENSISLFSLWRGLIPGTKWCGLGDAADSYDDLGTKRDIDLCCRAHDHCPVRLKLESSQLEIELILTTDRSHCDCDEDFLKCLKGSTNSYATMLGNFYFNVLKVQCIKEERPLVCVEFRKNSSGKEDCARYDVSNETKMKFISPELKFQK